LPLGLEKPGEALAFDGGSGTPGQLPDLRFVLFPREHHLPWPVSRISRTRGSTSVAAALVVGFGNEARVIAS
jgi:hypothetical protein